MGQLDGKVGLITGSGRGQGLVAAQRFAAEGARIVINDIDTESVNAAVEAVRSAGGEAAAAVGDVSKADDVQRVLQVANDTFGGLDILLRIPNWLKSRSSTPDVPPPAPSKTPAAWQAAWPGQAWKSVTRS